MVVMAGPVLTIRMVLMTGDAEEGDGKGQRDLGHEDMHVTETATPVKMVATTVVWCKIQLVVVMVVAAMLWREQG